LRPSSTQSAGVADRLISLGSGLAQIPERLLLAHARGQVLFIVGAGVSRQAGLPDFRGLVLDVYKIVDTAVHSVIANGTPVQNLKHSQEAEIDRFYKKDFDVALGMLERRMERPHAKSKVRNAVATVLLSAVKSAPIHRAILSLSDRGGTTAVVTTNFELLLQHAARTLRQKVATYSLGGIPRPGRTESFAGILHIHGALEASPASSSELVLTDQDFGEYYLRRRVVPDFIYDAARLFNLVLVGYSADDPPMRYLLNAVAADGTRFDDIKERFIFWGESAPDPVAIEDWKARGITPIAYDSVNDHAVLLATLQRWAELSAINGNQNRIDAEIKRIVKTKRGISTDADSDLFDHLIRRSNPSERIRLSALASRHNADIDWLTAIIAISKEPK